MSMLFKHAAPGFLEGQLKIVSLREEVEPSDEMPRRIVTTKRYAQYPLIILSQEEKKEIARVTADENGNYRVGLQPGNYVLDVQDREQPGPIHSAVHQITGKPFDVHAALSNLLSAPSAEARCSWALASVLGIPRS